MYYGVTLGAFLSILGNTGNNFANLKGIFDPFFGVCVKSKIATNISTCPIWVHIYVFLWFPKFKI